MRTNERLRKIHSSECHFVSVEGTHRVDNDGTLW
jgi:hypothetical protein